MEWVLIDKMNLPNKEVLAANFQPGTYGYKEKLIGYLGESEEGVIGCESDNELLENCTHYIDLNLFDIQSQTKS